MRNVLGCPTKNWRDVVAAAAAKAKQGNDSYSTGSSANRYRFLGYTEVLSECRRWFVNNYDINIWRGISGGDSPVSNPYTENFGQIGKTSQKVNYIHIYHMCRGVENHSYIPIILQRIRSLVETGDARKTY